MTATGQLELFSPNVRTTDPVTSHIAAASIDTTTRHRLCDDALTIITATGSHGATVDEIFEQFINQHPHVRINSLSRRLTDLNEQGRVTRAGTRPGLAGRPQTVWRDITIRSYPWGDIA